MCARPSPFSSASSARAGARSVLWLASATLLCLACRRSGTPTPGVSDEPEGQMPPPSSERLHHGAEANEVGRGVLPSHASTRPEPPKPPPQRLACFRRWLVALTDRGYRWVSLSGLGSTEYSLAEPGVAVVPTVGRTALLLGRHRLYRLYGGQREPWVFDGVSLLGPTQLWADREVLSAVFLWDVRETALQRVVLSGSGAGLNYDVEYQALADFDGRWLEQLADGSWLYSVESGWARRFGTRQWRYEGVPAARLVASGRPGQVWVASAERVLLMTLEPLEVVQSWTLAGAPLQLQGDAARALAIVATSGGVVGTVLERQGANTVNFDGGATASTSYCLVPGQRQVASWDGERIGMTAYGSGAP